MNIETKIHLDRFSPRPYQYPICRALEQDGFRKILAILPRRAGKDVVCFNLMIRSAIRRIGVYFYIFPTYSQAKKVIWNSINNDGQKFLDYIPQELVASTNGQEMIIKLKNGSIIQLIGSDNIDSIVGTNPIGCVFSEYALQDPRAYQFIRPILTANLGWAIFISTPRGKNHMWDLYQVAQQLPDWFCYKLTIEDTNHIPLSEIEKERTDGIMSEDLIQQEYYTSFTMGVEGAYYARYLDDMRVKGRIGNVEWEPSFKVHVAFDLGVSDSTVLVWFQVIGQTIRIIDCYENSKQGLEHYVKILEEKPYSYAKYIFPHDIRVQELGSGITRIEKLRQLGVKATVCDNIAITDGIEAVRSAFSKMWIDEKNCAPLIKALENYRQEFDVKRKVYKNHPLHNWASHYADCMRYLCVSLPKTRDGLSPEELDKRYRDAVYGSNSNMPEFFRNQY